MKYTMLIILVICVTTLSAVIDESNYTNLPWNGDTVPLIHHPKVENTIDTKSIIEYYELQKKIERLEARIDTLEKKIKVLEQAVEYEVMKTEKPDDDVIDAIIEDLDEIWKEIFWLKYYKK